MNILFLVHRFIGYGGIEKVTQLLAKELNRKYNHNIWIYSLIKQETEETQFLSTYYKTIITSYKTPNDIKAEFNELLKSNNIQIVIFQDSYTHIEYLLDVVNKNKTKIITVEHNTPDCFIKNHIEYCNKLKYTPKDLIRRLLIPYKRRRLYLNEKSRREKLIKVSDRYILLSPRYRTILKENYNIESSKVLSITNPIANTINIDIQKEKNILFVGRLVKEKGIEYLIDLWTILEKKLPQNWKLQIVGNGELKDYLVKEINNRKLKRIELHNFTSDIQEFYQKSTILCSTSKFEGLPLVLPEAMSFGVIPFAFDSFISIYDIIDNGKNGYIIPHFNTEEYANKIYKYINMPLEEQILISKNAIIKSKKFSLEEVTKKWHKLFIELYSIN